MPQMNPMNWFLLFIYFNALLFFTATKIFFFMKKAELGLLTGNKSETANQTKFLLSV